MNHFAEHLKSTQNCKSPIPQFEKNYPLAQLDAWWGQPSTAFLPETLGSCSRPQTWDRARDPQGSEGGMGHQPRGGSCREEQDPNLQDPNQTTPKRSSHLTCQHHWPQTWYHLGAGISGSAAATLHRLP